MASPKDVIEDAVASLKEKLSDLPNDEIRKIVLKTIKKEPKSNPKVDTLVEEVKCAMAKYTQDSKPMSAKRWKEYAMRAWLEMYPDGKVRHTRVYDTFKSEKMKEIKRASPGISFGDMMKQVAAAWKEEKARALSAATTSGATESESTTTRTDADPGNGVGNEPPSQPQPPSSSLVSPLLVPLPVDEPEVVPKKRAKAAPAPPVNPEPNDVEMTSVPRRRITRSSRQ
jgi:hypothetical protein